MKAQIKLAQSKTSLCVCVFALLHTRLQIFSLFIMLIFLTYMMVTLAGLIVNSYKDFDLIKSFKSFFWLQPVYPDQNCVSRIPDNFSPDVRQRICVRWECIAFYAYRREDNLSRQAKKRLFYCIFWLFVHFSEYLDHICL